MEIRRVLLVGLGKAAWNYSDGLQVEDNERFQRHTDSILSLQSLQLIGGVDVQESVANAWGNRYSKSSYTELPELDFQEKDIVVISTDIKNLSKCLVEVALKFPKSTVLVEKPVAISESDLLLLNSIGEDRRRLIFVNFPRIFQPETNLLKFEIGKLIQENNIKSLNISAEYSKGFLNTGSHLIVLLRYLFDREMCITPIGEVTGTGITEGFDFRIESKDLFVRGIVKYNPSIEVSTFSISTSLKTHHLKYSDGGREVTITNSRTHEEYHLKSTREQYQLEVYKRLSEYSYLSLISSVGLGSLLPTLVKMIDSLENARRYS